MSWSEAYHAINTNQYGGRKGVQNQLTTLNKTLTLDIVRYYSDQVSIIDNDTQACYHRILIVLLCYVVLRLGLPVHLICFLCNWMRQAQYLLKLHDRLIVPCYSTSTLHLQGTGQGTGWSPPNWSSISDLITCAMDHHTPGIKLVHPNRSATYRKIDVFMNNTNSGLTQDDLNDFNPSPQSPVSRMTTIYDQMATNHQFYSDLLTSLGDKLILYKSTSLK